MNDPTHIELMSSSRRPHYHIPIALLIDAFQPLGFFASEFFASLAPLLPAKMVRRLYPNVLSSEALARFLDEVNAHGRTDA